MNIWMTLKKALDLYPDKTGVVDGNRSFTYRQVGERVAGLARYFQKQRILPEDRISILEVNSHAFLETYYAAAGIGAILNPLNYRLAAREVAFILNDAGSRWLIAATRFADVVRDVLKEGVPLEGIVWIGDPPDASLPLQSHRYEDALSARAGYFEPVSVDENRVAHLYYTSGTTGRPKGVMLTHKNVCSHALGTIAELKLVDTDVWGHIAPMFHLADAWATFAITWVGAQHVMVAQFEAEAVMAIIQRQKITLSNLIPTMLNLMIKHPRVCEYDFTSLREILSGGAPIAPELVKSIMETLGCDYVQTYGMTETSPYLTFSILKEHLNALPADAQLKYKSKTGRPAIGVDLKVMDEQGDPIAADEQQVGEIWVRGDTITPGYWNRPEETADAFSDGWLRTGDLATLDSEGYVNIVDRKKDMIVTGGENVYSTEVENVLYMHPKILEAAVFGVPDERWGEAVNAAVVLRAGESATADEIIAFCKEHQAAYKAPKNIVFLDELPKTGSGKIYKKGLRDPFLRKKADR
ncbi:MAG: long-chain-fatty-acid--CoA ligase [Deltaproteobacteria bacterium]|jgi:acyl-CoA synthetase (AMP-forming)/AMP-acid ligase II|nr:long-chain-fatty-acid--CoA ligase [Deltaproteobacteria bacterium]